MSTKQRNKKMLAARVLCTLLLGTYFVGGYGEPVAWGAGVSASHIYEDDTKTVTADQTKVASAWGFGSVASGSGATAWGGGYLDDGTYYQKGGTASGSLSTAFGRMTEATAYGATAWGKETKAYGSYSTAFGSGTKASSEHATAWGVDTTASGLQSTAWGVFTTASGMHSTSFGANTKALFTASTAFGSGAKAGGFYSTAFGYYTEAIGEGATTWGYKTKAGQLLYGSEKTEAAIVSYKEGGTTKYKIVDANDEATTLKGGFTSYSEAYNDSALEKLGNHATAWGKYTEAIGEGATAWGVGTEDNKVIASGYGSTAFGNGTQATGRLATAWGAYTNAAESYATAWGIGAEATNVGATAFGNDAVASGKYSTAFGWVTKASGQMAVAFGQSTEAIGQSSLVFGQSSVAAGSASAAWGYDTQASSTRSTAWGSDTQAGKVTYNGKEVKIVEYSDAGKYYCKIIDRADETHVYETGISSWAEAYDKVQISGFAATAFGDNTYASGPDSTAFGVGTAASGKGATAFGGGTTADGDYSVAWGTESKVQTGAENSTAFGNGSTVVNNVKNALAALGGKVDTGADNSAAIGDGASVTVADTVALGSKSVASREAGATDAYLKGSNSGNAWKSTHNAIAVGNDDTVTRQITGVAAGSKDTDAVNVAQLKSLETAVAGEISNLDTRVSATESALATAVTDISDLKNGKLDKADYEADKATTQAALDGKANVALDNITDDGKTAVRNLAKESVKVVAGTNTTVTEGTDGNAKTYAVDVVTNGAVASGDTGIVTGGTVYDEVRPAADGNYIKAANTAATNLGALDTQVKANTDAIGTTADGTYVKSSDSVGTNLNTLDTELAALAGGTSAGLSEVNHRIDNLDSKTDKVGAGAAALAALHPMDTDGKFGLALGYGNYRSANAMAMGLFYRPTDRVMFSIGGSMGNGENLMNVGVSFALDKGITTSKAAMARTIKAQGEEIQSLKAENAKLAERLAAIEAKLAK